MFKNLSPPLLDYIYTNTYILLKNFVLFTDISILHWESLLNHILKNVSAVIIVLSKLKPMFPIANKIKTSKIGSYTQESTLKIMKIIKNIQAKFSNVDILS